MLKEKIQESEVAESIAKIIPQGEIWKSTRFDYMIEYVLPVINGIHKSYKNVIQGSMVHKLEMERDHERINTISEKESNLRIDAIF